MAGAAALRDQNYPAPSRIFTEESNPIEMIAFYQAQIGLANSVGKTALDAVNRHESIELSLREMKQCYANIRHITEIALKILNSSHPITCCCCSCDQRKTLIGTLTVVNPIVGGLIGVFSIYQATTQEGTIPYIACTVGVVILEKFKDLLYKRLDQIEHQLEAIQRILFEENETSVATVRSNIVAMALYQKNRASANRSTHVLADRDVSVASPIESPGDKFRRAVGVVIQSNQEQRRINNVDLTQYVERSCFRERLKQEAVSQKLEDAKQLLLRVDCAIDVLEEQDTITRDVAVELSRYITQNRASLDDIFAIVVALEQYVNRSKTGTSCNVGILFRSIIQFVQESGAVILAILQEMEKKSDDPKIPKALAIVSGILFWSSQITSWVHTYFSRRAVTGRGMDNDVRMAAGSIRAYADSTKVLLGFLTGVTEGANPAEVPEELPADWRKRLCKSVVGSGGSGRHIFGASTSLSPAFMGRVSSLESVGGDPMGARRFGARRAGAITAAPGDVAIEMGNMPPASSQTNTLGEKIDKKAEEEQGKSNRQVFRRAAVLGATRIQEVAVENAE